MTGLAGPCLDEGVAGAIDDEVAAHVMVDVFPFL